MTLHPLAYFREAERLERIERLALANQDAASAARARRARRWALARAGAGEMVQ